MKAKLTTSPASKMSHYICEHNQYQSLLAGEDRELVKPSLKRVLSIIFVCLSFLLEDITLAADVFSSCFFIPRAHFESSSVMVSFYGYEI